MIPDPLKPIQATLRWLVVATVVLFLAMSSLTIWTYVNSHQNKVALCALREDLATRVASSTDFLRRHPHGIPGIPAATIQEGIANQTRTIDALSGLSC